MIGLQSFDQGIYETKVPLEFNAILQSGCVCKVDKTAKKRNIQDGWSLSELHTKTTTECSYLEQSIPFFYLYHSISEGRAIYIGYFPASRTISVVVVNPYQNKDLSPSFLEYDQDMHSGAHVLNEQVGFDEDTSCAPAFRVLKQLIQRCLADAVTFGNVYADAILQHLYRWLCRLQHLNFDLYSSWFWLI